MSGVPFRIADVETNGLKRADGAQVCEIGYVDLLFDPETRQSTVGQPHSLLFGVDAMPIPALATHHITMAMLAGRGPCLEADLLMAAHAEGPWGVPQFFAAHVLEMEAQWFTPQVLGAIRPICTFKVARRAYPDLETYSNHGVRYALGLEDLPEDLCQPAHRAAPDAYTTARVLGEMLKTVRVADMVRWTAEPTHYPTCPMGKHRGKPWSEIEASYLTWMLGQADMDSAIKHAAQQELERRRSGG